MEIAHKGVAGRLRALPTRLINQVAIVADRATERALEDTGSRRHHYALLTTLREFGPASQADLGRRTRIDRSDIVAALNDLADRGFVERSPDPGDRRRNIVTLTRPGDRHLDDLDGRLDTAQDELLAALSAAERRQLVGLLTRILDDHSRS
ncbi:MarR family winged helix-turn-helix transcriptional regulator [Nocardia bhagyanarayanae]|uniref:DNA-binding MarR family transcriptional regulator n=1 Tax=Nocardia bhagyanarayanae TaxID=1215925 RepID=A0A543EX19_9NOCA|nr:MarR family transcriptional regulator [Nocardia bhagyanarayanae]TQM26094.1 DNA-binding MarR family transcriptional regulator [Nocardia bhagyanarayanae]